MKWTRGPLIGRGSTATVSAAVVHPDGEILAVKSVELTRRRILENEQKLHSTIRCPYIIEYKGQDVTVENGKPMYNIFMEFASSGSLAESIAKLRHNDEVTISLYTRSILKGLEYLHSRRIVHCDIKPCNILVTGNGGVKIGDFGCARLADDVAGSNWQISGTPIYMAPEVARGEQQGYPADVWALGCTVIEMVTRQAPWVGVSDPVCALYRIGFSGQVPEIPESVSDEARDFLRKCLNSDPDRRWSVNQLLQHPFVTAVNPVHLTKLPPGHGLCSGSPTSVLNCDLKWDDLCSSTRDEEEDPTRLLKSPEERIRNLIGPGSCTEPGSDPDDESCWVTVRSYCGKACFSDRVELESQSFDVENYENSFISYFGDEYCNTNIDAICTTATIIASGDTVNSAGEFSRTIFWQFDSCVCGFEFNSIAICKPIYFGCVALCVQ